MEVNPQILYFVHLPSPVHAPVHGLPVLVRARPPGVVPEAAPAALLLIADDVRDDPAFSLQLGEPAEDREATGSSSNDANLSYHCQSTRKSKKLIRIRRKIGKNHDVKSNQNLFLKEVH